MEDWIASNVAAAADAVLWLGGGNALLSLVIAYFLLIALGLFLSMRGWLTVYRDFTDILLTLLLPLIPLLTLALAYVLALRTGTQMAIPGPFIVLACAGLSALILVRSLADNGEVFKAALAFVIKVPLAVICALALVELLFARSGGESRTRQRRRQASMALTAGLAGGLMLMFVRDKSSLPFRSRHG